jgi:DNA-directed RNA polymerase sigma subunit (sigma70/sigma32)
MSSDQPGPLRGESALRQRLRALADAPLLTSGEELAAAVTVADGQAAENELARMEDAHPVEPEVMAAFADRIQRGEDARQLLLGANRRLVVSIARRHQAPEGAVDALLAAGDRALERAVDRFDPHGSLSFGSFARWWIEHAMRAVSDQLTHDRPGGLSADDEGLVLNALARLHEPDSRLLELRLGLRGRPVTTDEASKILGVAPDRVEKEEEQALAKLRHPCTPGNLRHLRRLA